jgi:TRAP-type C4-dicarboxylate transport system permease small subunit
MSGSADMSFHLAMEAALRIVGKALGIVILTTLIALLFCIYGFAIVLACKIALPMISSGHPRLQMAGAAIFLATVAGLLLATFDRTANSTSHHCSPFVHGGGGGSC